MRLPVITDGAAACAECSGPCCLEHAVPIGGTARHRHTPRLGRHWGAGGAHAETLADDAGERVLYSLLRERWDRAAMSVPVEQPLSPDRFVQFLDGAYDAIAPLRASDRAAWEPEASRLIAEFPLP